MRLRSVRDNVVNGEVDDWCVNASSLFDNSSVKLVGLVATVSAVFAD